MSVSITALAFDRLLREFKPMILKCNSASDFHVTSGREILLINFPCVAERKGEQGCTGDHVQGERAEPRGPLQRARIRDRIGYTVE